MRKMICEGEIINCDNFKHRICLTKKFESQGVFPQHIGNNSLFVYYTTIKNEYKVVH